MVNIKTLPDRIIFDGHADTAKECETITLMCDGLACNDNFRTVAYRKGYAEFEKVGAARELKFISGTQLNLSINADAHITAINGDDGNTHIYNYPYPSGDTSWSIAWTLPIQCSVAFDTGYVIDNISITGSGDSLLTVSNITDSTFTITLADVDAGVGFSATLTITSKLATSKLNIDLTTLSGYSTLQAGSTYAITVKAKAANYQDSDASASVNYTVPGALAAPVITASDTTITWDAVENAESYDVYMDGELYENTDGGATVTYPVKGDLITLDNKTYRVLKVNDSVAEVLAMYDSTGSQAFNDSGNSNVYANSSLDVYLSQIFYNSLSTTMQNAIVTKTFQQDEWSWESGTSDGTGTAIYQGIYALSQYRLGLTNASYGTSISRKCYVLSVQDVIDYLEVTTSMDVASTTLTSENVWRMFWNRTTSLSSTYPWLRSANYDSFDLVFTVIGEYGSLDYDSSGSGNSAAVRPAFQIDLSKIEWTKQ